VVGLKPRIKYPTAPLPSFSTTPFQVDNVKPEIKMRKGNGGFFTASDPFLPSADLQALQKIIELYIKNTVFTLFIFGFFLQ
jgi:hypothetical protein